MTYASDAQRRYLHAIHPQVAARMDAEEAVAKAGPSPSARLFAAEQYRQDEKRAKRRALGVAGVAGAGLLAAEQGRTREGWRQRVALQRNFDIASAHPLPQQIAHNIEAMRRLPRGAAHYLGLRTAAVGAPLALMEAVRAGHAHRKVNQQVEALAARPATSSTKTYRLVPVGKAFTPEPIKPPSVLTRLLRRTAPKPPALPKPGPELAPGVRYLGPRKPAVAPLVPRDQLAKGLLRLPTGPVKKAPTIARTGGFHPKRALLIPQAHIYAKRGGMYDPEGTRQRHLGEAAALSGGGGLYLVATGGRQAVSSRAIQNNAHIKAHLLSAAKHHPHLTKPERTALTALGARKASLIHHGTLTRLGGGIALLGVSGRLLRTARDRRWN